MTKKRGFSILEVVIALTIVTFVSAATLTLIFTSINVERKNLAQRYAVQDGASIISCYDFSYDSANTQEFEDDLYVLFKGVGENEELKNRIQDSALSDLEITRTDYGYTLTVTADGDGLTIKATFKGETIYDVRYEK